MELGLFLIRAVVGLTLAAHGAQKLFGAFGGHGIAGTGGFFESIGFRPGRPMALVAGLGETLGGLAFAAGLMTPLAAGVILATMLVAIFGVHLANGFFAQGGGFEHPLLIATVALGVAFAGPGPLSLDAVLGIDLSGVQWGLIAVGLGIIGATPPLLARSATMRQSASARR